MNLLFVALIACICLSGFVRTVPISQLLQQPSFSANINPIFQQPMLQPANQQLMMQQQHPTMTNNLFFQQMRQQQQQPFINQFMPQQQSFINQQQPQIPLGVQSTFITQQQQPLFQQQPQQYSQHQQQQIDTSSMNFLQQPSLQNVQTVQTVVQDKPVVEVKKTEIETQRQPLVVDVQHPVTTVEVKKIDVPVSVSVAQPVLTTENPVVSTVVTNTNVVERTPTEIYNLIQEQNDDLEMLKQLVSHHVDQNKIIMDDLRTFVRQNQRIDHINDVHTIVTDNLNVAPMKTSVVVDNQRPILDNKVNFVSTNTQNLPRVQQQQNFVVDQNTPIQTTITTVPNRQQTTHFVSDNTQQLNVDQQVPNQFQQTNTDNGGFNFPRLESFVHQQQKQQTFNNRFQ